MLFHSAKFAIFFLVVFAVYWMLKEHRRRMLWLLLASCVFYMSWNPWLISLILFSASLDYLLARRINASEHARARKLLLLTSIVTNLSLLGFFKYTNFFLDTAVWTGNWIGLSLSPVMIDLILPLGISFYTFETISYVVDVYRRRTEPVKGLLDYALYIMFFPHLIAGPIVRPREFIPQLKAPKRFNWHRMQVGVGFFLLGLFKKAVIADHLAQVADPIFASPEGYASAMVWLGVLCYAVQIYCDFSGYSDMAIGCAHMLGFKLPLNFNMPYLASSITDFWHRWHITLSRWLRDYIYIPLGGNRHGTLMTYRNLMLTMLLGGLWHGASWTFVAWGFYHGLLLSLDRAIPKPAWWSSRAFRPLAIASTFLLVCIGWVFFRAQTFGDARTILGAMFQPVSGAALSPALVIAAWGFLGVVLLSHLLGSMMDWRRARQRWAPMLMGGSLAALAVLALFLRPETGSAFIYFQF